MSTAMINKMPTSKKIEWIISIAIPLALWLIPTGDVYTTQVRWYCVWTVWMLLVVAFDLLNQFIPAFLMPVMYYIFNRIREKRAEKRLRKVARKEGKSVK